MMIAPENPPGPRGRGRKRRGRRPAKSGQNGQSQSQPQSQSKSRSQQQRKSPGSRNNPGGIYTAPMDHNYNTGGGDASNRGGRSHSGLPTDLDPLPIFDGPQPHIFAFVEDLFFSAKIQETARKLGIKVDFQKTDKDLLEHLHMPEGERIALVIVDLNNNGTKPLPLITKLRSKLKKATSIVGFVSHVQGELKVAASEAGCDMVLPRSAFSQNLPQLLRRHATPDNATQEMPEPASRAVV